jgi:hypothetical protein
MTNQPNEKRILITIPSTETESISFLEVFLCSLRKTETVPKVILHFPAVLLGSTDAATRRRVVSLVVDGLLDRSISLWSAGFAGAAADMLRPEHAEREESWAISNRWKWGFRDAFGVSELPYVPFNKPVPALPDYADGVIHIVLPRYGMAELALQDSGERLAGLLAAAGTNEGAPSSLVYAPGSPDGPFLAGQPIVGAYAPEREPLVLAEMQRVRAAGDQLQDDRSQRDILLVAADRGMKARRVVNRVSPGKGGPSPDLFDRYITPRDLQGSVLGRLTIQEEDVVVAYAAGRLSGVTRRQDRGLRRAQGFLQYRKDRTVQTAYLETELAAWFTGDGIRGVQEIARTGDAVTVETASIVRDGVPAVLINQRYTCREQAPDGIRASLFELPLSPVDPGEVIRLSATAAPSGSTAATDSRTVASTEGAEITFPASGVTVETAFGRVSLFSALTPDAGGPVGALAVPFHFAVVPSRDGLLLVFRPFRMFRTIERGRWTASYIISPVSPDVHRLNDLGRDAVGFTSDPEA